jgi:ferredoxin
MAKKKEKKVPVSADGNKSEHIKKTARKVLEDGTVKFVIGYEDGTYGGRDQPSFAERPEDCDSLKWGPSCSHNLSVYIMDDKRKPLKRGEEPDKRPIGLVIKGCDSMGIVELIKENIITRDDVYLIGVECDGVVDHEKLEERLWSEKVPVKAILDIKLRREGDQLLVDYGDDQLKIPLKDVALDKCLECERHTPLIYDVLAGKEDAERVEAPDKEKAKAAAEGSEDFSDVEEIEAMSLEERWEYWQKELGKCIRCYACRSVCPMCYCEQCVVDPSTLSLKPQTTPEEKARRPKWIEKNTDFSETLFFHLIRALHNAGRCTDCGECERACPMDIPLRKLTKKLRKDMKELFGYEPGVDIDDKPALATIRADDPEEYVR